MSDLFAHSSAGSAPLPGRLRPQNWDDFVGQESFLRMVKGKKVHSMILYGPPGCGKTTVARILARESGMDYEELSAVSSGVKEVRDVIRVGKTGSTLGKPVLLFIDEIHRFSKSQQDALLEAVESGWVILIGATTENPSFEVIGPLLSRCQVYRLESLSDSALERIVNRALAFDPMFATLRLEESARELLIEAGSGDARKTLRWLEIAAETVLASRSPDHGEITLEKKDIALILQNRVRNYDKAGENHYDYISAFIKSMRASDPDAALIYLACMIDGGEDPLFIARRMVIFASEDVGNAYPQALGHALDGFMALERIGMPEGRIILGQMATLLAGLPKSNAAYTGINEALASVKGKRIPVPAYLRNAPTRTHRMEGAGEGYLYPHDFPGGFAGQDCRPEEFRNTRFYRPGSSGYEAKIVDRLNHLWPRRAFKEEQSGNPEEEP